MNCRRLYLLFTFFCFLVSGIRAQEDLNYKILNDCTSKINNPSYDDGIDGWEQAYNQTNGSGACGVTTEGENSFWQCSYNTYLRHATVCQKGIQLEAGVYRLSAQMKGTPKDDTSTYIYATVGDDVNHWSTPVFPRETWFGYLKQNADDDWTEVYTYIILSEEQTIRIGALSWGNNYSGGTGGAFSVDDWKLEQVAYGIEATTYIVGDVNNNGNASVDDIPYLINALNQGDVSSLPLSADINENGVIDKSDIDALASALVCNEEVQKEKLPLVENLGPVKVRATVYAEQMAAENAESANYMIDGSVNAAKADVSTTKMFTTLNIDISALSNVQSVSVYAKGKEDISGVIHEYNVTDGTYSLLEDTNFSNVYYSTPFGDVVTVNNDNNASTLTAYLIPVTLSQGVTVTVLTTDGLYYSQDFADITPHQANSLTFTSTTATNNWMATIPGNTYYGMVSTPCAHDAATSSISLSTAKCQEDNLSTLLANGVRGFDIRPGYLYNSTLTASNLYIYHSVTNTKVLYTEAMKIFVNFLKEHPTETISIIMTKEKNSLVSTDRSDEMWAVLNACHSEYGDYMKTLDHSYYTLDDFRGKICYVNRNGTACTNTTQITNWPDDSSVTDYSCVVGLCKANVEDYYNASTSDKKTAALEMLNLAASNTDKANLHYTYLSIANSPKSYANTMNPWAIEQLQNIDGPIGYVYADYIGGSSCSGKALNTAIVEQNYKYVFKGRTRNK